MSQVETPAPLLFMKTGLIGSAPDGFFEALADHFDAEIHSYVRVRDERIAAGRTVPRRAGLQSAARTQTRATLQRGASALFDSYVNRRDQRTPMLNLAADCGARALVMVVNTPPVIIEDRLEAKLAQAFRLNDLDAIDAADRKLTAYERMINDNDVEIPAASEPYVVLDGMLPVPELVASVDTFLMREL